jgi:DsbE subfamily thiol:disulfide oxidoreductase
MKHRGAVLLVLLLLAGIMVVLLDRREEVPAARAVVGMPAPDFQLEDLRGNKVRLSDFRGKAVLINFWATWCDSCREEAAGLQRLAEDKEFAQSLQTLKIVFRDSGENAARYLKDNNFTFRALVDDRRTSVNYGVRAVPESFLVSGKGVLRQKYIGPVDWDAPAVRARLRTLISGE